LKISDGKTISNIRNPVERRLKNKSSGERGISSGDAIDLTKSDLEALSSSGVGVGVVSGVGVGDSSGSSVGSSVISVITPVVGLSVGRVVGLGVGVGVLVGAGAEVGGIGVAVGAGGEVGVRVGVGVGGQLGFGLFGVCKQGSIIWAETADEDRMQENRTNIRTDNTLFMQHYYNQMIY
jgi:hypothetical protein